MVAAAKAKAVNDAAKAEALARAKAEQQGRSLEQRKSRSALHSARRRSGNAGRGAGAAVSAALCHSGPTIYDCYGCHTAAGMQGQPCRPSG